MENLNYQNEQLPGTEDLNQAQTDIDNAVRKRFSDQRPWGIVHANPWPSGLVVPVSGINPAPNLIDQISEFTLSFDTQLGIVNVGAGSVSTGIPRKIGGVAYDLNSERIAILNDAAFNFSTATPQGVGNSGNLQVPLTLSGTSGGYPANTPVYGIYYLWIQYLEINDPNYPVVVGPPSNAKTYPHMLDGYQIVVTGTPIAPQGDGLSIFLGKVVWGIQFPEILTITAGTASSANGNSISTIPLVTGDPGRNYSLIRSQGVDAIIDPNNPTSNYAPNQEQSARDHFNALGHGTVSSSNPHGIALIDIPGATAEPKAVSNQAVSLAQGIIDTTINSSTGAPNVPQNSPAFPSTALKPSAGGGTLSPANLDTFALSQQGQGSAGISSNPQAAWVRISQLLTGQYAYVQGNQLAQVYPSLRQTSDHLGDSSINSNPTSGDGWVGFSNSGTVDPTGFYRIFGSYATLSSGNSVLLLQKQFLSTFPTIPAEYPGNLTLATVYWDGTQLTQTPVDVLGSAPNDLRSLGLIGPQQISTKGKGDANNGMLANEGFSNLVANSNYVVGTAGVTELNKGGSYVINAGAPLTASGDPTMAQAPVGAITGRIWTINAGSSAALGDSFIFHQLGQMRPGKPYSISIYYKTTSNFNARLQIALFGANTASAASLMTLDGSTTLSPVDLVVLNDGLWHRASFIVQTLPGLNPATNSWFLGFVLSQGAAGTQAASLSMTNLQVTEGEWTTGYSAGVLVPHGFSVFSDVLSTCPPGWVENTNLRGTVPMGWQPTDTHGLENLGPLGNPATRGDEIAYHSHGLQVAGFSPAGSSGAYFLEPASGGNTNPAAANLGVDVGVWCTAL